MIGNLSGQWTVVLWGTYGRHTGEAVASRLLPKVVGLNAQWVSVQPVALGAGS